MIQLKIAFLDEEELYLEQLKGYFVQKKENFFKIYTFTDADSFLKSRITEQFDAVVMTYPFWEMMKEQDFQKRRSCCQRKMAMRSKAACMWINTSQQRNYRQRSHRISGRKTEKERKFF